MSELAPAITIRYDGISPFSRGDSIETRLMLGKGNAEETPFTTGTTAFPVGCAALLHSRECAEQVTILEGQAEAMIGGEVIQLVVMDTSFVPANVPRWFRNSGQGRLVILWI